jgi:hypothetical protein
MTMTRGDTVVRRAAAPWRRLGNDVLVAPPGREDFERLTGPAARVWILLSGDRSVRELERTLGAEPGLQEVLAQLGSRGLIEEVAT